MFYFILNDLNEKVFHIFLNILSYSNVVNQSVQFESQSSPYQQKPQNIYQSLESSTISYQKEVQSHYPLGPNQQYVEHSYSNERTNQENSQTQYQCKYLFTIYLFMFSRNSSFGDVLQ